MPSPRLHIFRKPLIFLILVMAGCTQGQLTGVVRNIEGEELPGVSIQVPGTDISAVSNALGEYTLSVEPGEHELIFAKTGYTISSLSVRKNEVGNSPVPDVMLWNLPPQKSVYLYHDTQYTETTRVTPQRFYMQDGTIDYGVRSDPDTETPFNVPQILFYRTPRYDVRLSRLHEEIAKLTNDDSQTFPVWTAAGTVGVNLQPVEPADPTLLKLDLDQPLQPGRYAIHWGALEGYDTIDARIYMFEVLLSADPSLDEHDPLQEAVPVGPEQVKGDAP